MKKLLLATAVVFAASQASAELLTVSLNGLQTQVSPVDGSDLGSGVSVAENGTYNTETGELYFSEVTTEQKANVLGNIIPLTLTGDLSASFSEGSALNRVISCAGNALACSFAVGDQPLEELTGGPADFSNPFADSQTFTFGGIVYNSQATVTLNYTITGPAPTSEVPVPAAAWLFGSALVGLAGLRKRK